MEIKDVFDAAPWSTWRFMCENGQGFYVPAYQRQYSWDRSNIERLFEDASHGLNMLVEHEESVTFLGTIIAIHDTRYATVSPLVRADVPGKVMTIIDGQQRLTTLLLFNVALHDIIERGAAPFSKSSGVAEAWLYNEARKTCAMLAKTYEEDMAYGDGPYQYYPRMIRAYIDSWSRVSGKAKYNSPIGELLFQYGQHVRLKTQKVYSYKPSADHSESQKHKFIRKTHEIIKKLAVRMSRGELSLPDLDVLAEAERLQTVLFNDRFSDDIKGRLTLDAQDKRDEQFQKLVRLVMFANFVLHRIAITVVTAKSEDFAFDIFEALNTTGEPLTAFETFRPRVIEAETLEDYELSESRKSMEAISAYLEKSSRSKKQAATSEILVPFALAETGKKLSKRLNEQRRYLRDQYAALEGIESKRAFTKHLEHCMLLIKHSWVSRDAPPELPGAMGAIDEETRLCLDLLGQAKHSIVIGLLVRYFSVARQSENHAKAVGELRDVIKAVTAFSVMWRMAHRTTANIDRNYRTLMAQGLADVGLDPLARKLSASLPSAALLRKGLRHLLKEKGEVSGKSDWVAKVLPLPVYKSQKDMARFVLLAAMEDSLPDVQCPGLLKRGRDGLLPVFNYDCWKSADMLTVEHIAPQSRPETGWGNDLYEDGELIDRFGNLTLLPKVENSSLSNRSWDEKRLIFRILSAASHDEAETLIGDGEKQGLVLQSSTVEILQRSRYIVMTKAIAGLDSNWSAEMVERRTSNILELGWEKIGPWLGF